MPDDLSKIERHNDGVLRASSLALNACENCDSVHVDLEGPDGKCFASGAIGYEHVPELMKRLHQLYEFLSARRGQQMQKH